MSLASSRSSIFLPLLALALLSGTKAVIHHGLLPKHQANFRHFAGKFVFDYRPSQPVGSVAVNLTRHGSKLENSGGRLIFCLFDDEKTGVHGFRNVKRDWQTRSCDEIMEHASLTRVLNLSSASELHFNVSIHETVRPRFWYYAFIGCGVGGQNGLSDAVSYQVHSENSLWDAQKEFSLDQMGLLTWHIILAVLIPVSAACTAILTIFSARDTAPMDHPFLRLLFLAYGAACASSCLFIAHYSFLAKNGFGSNRIRFLGILAGIIANCTMYLIAILSSVGWAISRSVLPKKRIFLVAVAAIGGFNALLELHAQATLDLSTKVYSYQSFPGMMALILKILMTCWFCFQLRGTYDRELSERNQKYYKVLGVGFTAWSLHVPASVIVCFFVAPYVRHQVVTVMDLVARLAGLIMFSVLFSGSSTPISVSNIFVMEAESSPFEKLSCGQ